MLIEFKQFLKLNKITNLELEKNYENFQVVMASSPDSSAAQKSNYRYLQNNLQAQELILGDKKILLLAKNSKDETKAQLWLKDIEELDFLDGQDYMEELEKEEAIKQAQIKSLGKCSMCGKALKTTQSALASMGPVCEAKSWRLEQGEDSLETYSNFKSLGSVQIERGQSWIIKFKQASEVTVGFFEVVKVTPSGLELVDRKKLSSFLNKQSPWEGILNSTIKIANQDILGLCSPIDESVKKEALWDDFLINLFEQEN